MSSGVAVRSLLEGLLFFVIAILKFSEADIFADDKKKIQNDS